MRGGPRRDLAALVGVSDDRRGGSGRARTQPVYAAATISWLGFLVHNVADLPGQTLLSPETLVPSLVTAVLVAAYAVGWRRVAAVGLLVWAILNLVGGSLSVLPLSVLPFEAGADGAPLLVPRAVRRDPDPADRGVRPAGPRAVSL